MLKLKDLASRYFSKDYFKIGAAGINKVRKVNRLFFISAGILIGIIIFYLTLIITTNYFKLGDFEDYIEEYNLEEFPSKFNQINLGIKIMPSYNLENNILYMRHSTDVSKSIKLNLYSIYYL
jgi:hypothetical protein